MHLLISGPVASGKSRLALERFRDTPGAILVVPTATMAEHMRHALARSGWAVRPRSVRTMAQLLEEFTPLRPAPQALIALLVERALEKLKPAAFRGVLDLAGFHHAAAALFEELPLFQRPENYAGIFALVEQNLARRGMARRFARLADAAKNVAANSFAGQARAMVFDGFFSFQPAELQLLLALAQQVPLTVTLPDGEASLAARTRLRAANFEETVCGTTLRASPVAYFTAATAERECEEIARRILRHVSAGRKFRETGIILRSREPYAALLETTLARFGIPARFYFSDPVRSHPAVEYLSRFVRALLAGWDHELLLSAIRMPVSGTGATPAGDRLDFAWRERLPAAGIPRDEIRSWCEPFDAWRYERHEARNWAAELRRLRTRVPVPVVGDRVDWAQADALRSTQAALVAFEEALDAAAEALDADPRMSLERFWQQAERVLATEPLRVEDCRRDTVHVMDVFEVRQWELPLVFLCGMVERHFPQYHREDPLLGDAERREMGMETAEDRQQQERFLFDLSLTRATAETVLSYPRFDEKGEETLPSFFLGSAVAEPCATNVRPALRSPSPRDTAPDPLPGLPQAYRHLSPSSIETFLQCPFQFYASRTVVLRTRPPAPRDRLDPLVQGSILHRALAELLDAPLLGTEVFDRAFEEECDRAHVPRSYRTEAVRLELLRNFEMFLDQGRLDLGSMGLGAWTPRTEEKFTYNLNSQLAIRGRIDRLEVSPRGEALVIDYKYSAASKIRDRIQQSASGDQVQAGLYLAAAARVFDYKPAGMLFCGLRNGVTWDGWHTSIPGLEPVGTSCTADHLEDMIQQAERTALDAHEAILRGRMAPEPADRKKCLWCEYRDICRVESIGTVREAGGG